MTTSRDHPSFKTSTGVEKGALFGEAEREKLKDFLEATLPRLATSMANQGCVIATTWEGGS